MKLRVLVLVVLLMTASGLAARPARSQDVYDGACVFSLVVEFDRTITAGGGGASLNTFDGAGLCGVSGVGLDPLRYALVGGGGYAPLAQCQALQMSGGYDITFSPSPAPPAGSGTWSFVGNVLGGVVTFIAPAFTGVAQVVANDGAFCGVAGVRRIYFSGVMEFLDP
ncbi:MAG: hypothetical protein WDA27_08850 [Actinomycetota bacterium]